MQREISGLSVLTESVDSRFFLSFPRLVRFSRLRVRKRQRTWRRKVLRLIQIRYRRRGMKNRVGLSIKFLVEYYFQDFAFNQTTAGLATTHNHILSMDPL